MDFVQASGEGFRRYFDFKTRSSRSEFWWFNLFLVVVSIFALIIDVSIFKVSLDGTGPIGWLWGLVTFIPSITITVRRLHDIDRSGWWFLLIFAIIIGWIVLLIWFCKKGTDGPNQFGDDPLGEPMSVFD